MRKILNILYVLVLSFAMVSCAKELTPRAALPASEGFEHNGKVTYTFTPCFGYQDANGGTKAFNTIPVDDHGVSTIRNIFFAVFDANGYKLSEYAAAVPNTYATENSPAVYSYSVELTVTDQPRIVHIIANAPDRISYGSEAEVIGSLTTEFDSDTWDGEDAYWTRIFLENGVWAQPDPADAGAEGYEERFEKFKQVRDTLSTARLVRNFAKITVINSATSNFQANRFWLTNIPDRGSIAPYNRNSGNFQIDYNTYHSVDALRGAEAGQGNYQGFYPASASLCTISGKSTAWLDAHATAISATPGVGGSSFCFEREVPKTAPLYVIVGGKYDSDSDGSFDDETETFYKIDLRDSLDTYFPILRNFDYRINVSSVKSHGASTVEAALSAAPSGDISTSIGLKDLTNISDGVSQIVVSETSRVIVGTSSGTDDFVFTFKFTPDLGKDTDHDGYADVCNNVLTDPAAIASARAAHESYVTIDSESGSTGDVFDHDGGNPWTIASADDAGGYRQITFHPVEASSLVKTEELTITGYYWDQTAGDGHGAWVAISRVVTYRLREKLTMTLSLDPNKIAAAEGEEIDLIIGIESGLPSSVFTLDMKIESEKLSLTSKGDAMPVSVGASTIPGSVQKSAFTFTKAITWEEYSNAPVKMVGDVGYKYFTCHFFTNTATISGNSDELWVSNPYFNQNHVGFTTFAPKTFSNITVSPNTDVHVGDTLSLGFRLSDLPAGGEVLIGFKGYEPLESQHLLTYVGSDSEGFEIYSYTASSTTVSGISIVPFFVGNCYVKLGGDEFTALTSSAVNAAKPIGGITIWADVDNSDATAINWVAPQGVKPNGENLIIGQEAKLTVYASSDDLSNLTINDLPTTRVTTGTGNTITKDGVTMYAYQITGIYTAPTTSSNYNLPVKNGTKSLGGFTVPVYGIAKNAEVTTTTGNPFSTSRYYYVQNYESSRYLYNNHTANSTSILKTTLDYSCLWQTSGTGTSWNLQAASSFSTGYTTYYLGSSGNNNVSLRTSSQTWQVTSYSSGKGLRIRRGTSGSRYIYGNNGNIAIQNSDDTSNNRYFHICSVTFTAP